MMNDAPEAELSKLLFEFSSFLHNVSHIRCQRKPQIELGDRTWRNIMNRADFAVCAQGAIITFGATSARRGDATTGARSQILQGRSECFSIHEHFKSDSLNVSRG